MNAKHLGNMPANPVTTEDWNSGVPAIGLTKREAIATAALQGICSNLKLHSNPLIAFDEASIHARSALIYADAMIAELTKELSKTDRLGFCECGAMYPEDFHREKRKSK